MHRCCNEWVCAGYRQLHPALQCLSSTFQWLFKVCADCAMQRWSGAVLLQISRGRGADMDCLSEQELRVWRNRIESWKCDTFMVPTPTQQSPILWNEKFFPLKKSSGPPMVRKVLLLLVGFCLVSQGSIFCVVHQKIRVLKHHPGLCRKWVCALLHKTEDVLQKSSVWMSTYSFSSRPSSCYGGAMKHTGLQIRGTKRGYI